MAKKNWAKSRAKVSQIMDCSEKKEIGINLKFILGNPDQEDWVTGIVGNNSEERRAKESGFQGSKPFPNGVFGEFGDAPDSQLVHDLLPVGLHCLHADG